MLKMKFNILFLPLPIQILYLSVIQPSFHRKFYCSPLAALLAHHFLGYHANRGSFFYPAMIFKSLTEYDVQYQELNWNIKRVFLEYQNEMPTRPEDSHISLGTQNAAWCLLIQKRESPFLGKIICTVCN